MSKASAKVSSSSDALSASGPGVGPPVSLSHVKVETPDGRMLIKDLSMDLQQGENLLVTGPNGAGKSSLFRVLGGLWPCKEGWVHGPSPAKREVLYLPQSPYLV